MKHKAISFLFIACSFSVLGWSSDFIKMNILFASLGATATLIFIYPHAPFSKWKNVFVAYALNYIISMMMFTLFPNHYFTLAIVLALTILVLAHFEYTHPPAAGIPIALFLHENKLQFGLILLISLSWLIFMAYLHSKALSKYGKAQ